MLGQLRTWAVVLLVATLAGACGPATRPAPQPAPNTSPPAASHRTGQPVEVRLTCATGDDQAPCAFEPAGVTIAGGQTVRWVNDDATYHTVTSSATEQVRRPSGRFHGVLDAAGEAYTVAFAQPGTYPYYCQPHAEFMAGVIRVVPE